jgi:antitoxin VapB
MAKAGVAKLFKNGRSQAVRLPREFRFQGDEVRIRKVGDAVLLEPMVRDTHALFEEMDRISAKPWPKNWRKQPRAPRRRALR